MMPSRFSWLGVVMVVGVVVVCLLSCLVVVVEGSLGNMGFMKLKRVPGGFNGGVVIPEEDLSSLVTTTQTTTTATTTTTKKRTPRTRQTKTAIQAARTDASPPQLTAASTSSTGTATTKGATTTTTTPYTDRIQFPSTVDTAPPETTTSSTWLGTTLSTMTATKRRNRGEVVVFDNGPNLRYQGIVLATNFVGFLVSLLLAQGGGPQRHYHVDLMGSGAFALGALPALLDARNQLNEKKKNNSTTIATKTAKIAKTTTTQTKNKNMATTTSSNKPMTAKTLVEAILTPPKTAVQRIQYTSIAVMTWSVKLALYLFWRVRDQGGDDRLDTIMQHPSYCAGFWAFSALWGIVCGLPYSLGLTSSRAATTGFGSAKSWQIGMTLFGAGWLLETTADYQKWVFKHDPQNKEKEGAFIKDGVWSWSQHPNWFGNLLLWSGIWIANLPALIDTNHDQQQQKQQALLTKDTKKTNNKKASPLAWWRRGLQTIWSWRRVALATLGPLFLYRLFDQQASGSMLGQAWEAKRQKYGYGTNLEYTQYIDRTFLCSLLFGVYGCFVCFVSKSAVSSTYCLFFTQLTHS